MGRTKIYKTPGQKHQAELRNKKNSYERNKDDNVVLHNSYSLRTYYSHHNPPKNKVQKYKDNIQHLNQVIRMERTRKNLPLEPDHTMRNRVNNLNKDILKRRNHNP